MGIQEVTLVGNGISPIGDYSLYIGEGNNCHEIRTGFCIHQRIKSAVMKVKFISDSLSYLIRSGIWYDIIFINAHAPAEDKDKLVKVAFILNWNMHWIKFPDIT